MPVSYGLLSRCKFNDLLSLTHFRWVGAGDLGHAELLPLVSRGHISEETHEHIVEQMVNGGVAEAEEILQ